MVDAVHVGGMIQALRAPADECQPARQPSHEPQQSGVLIAAGRQQIRASGSLNVPRVRLTIPAHGALMKP